MSFKRVRQTAGQKPAASQPPPLRSPAAGNQANLRRLQAKLTIGATNDPLEHEADSTADHIMRMPSGAAPPSVSRAGGTEGGGLQTKAPNAAMGQEAAPASVEAALQGPSQPLDSGLRSFFEPRFGADFSSVRVHNDEQAGRSAQEIGATAYATGQNLVFAPGAYAPASQSGRQLIAHELTHVLQQDAGGSASVQRDTPDPAAAPAPAPAPQSDPGVLDLAPAEDISTKNPKIIAFAATFQQKLAASPKTLLYVNAFYNSSASFDPGGSPKAVLAAPAVARAAKTRAVLFALGIPAAAITEHPADLNEGGVQGSDGATQLVTVDLRADLANAKPIMPDPASSGPVSGAAPAPTVPQPGPTAAKPAGSPLDFSKFTTIQIQTPNFSFAMKIPSSIEIKSKFVEGKISTTPGLALKFKPVPGNPGVEIGLSGELTSLSSLISPSTPAPGAPKATPPLKFSLSVGFNGKGFKIEARTDINLDNTNSALDNTPSANDGTPSADHRGKITSGVYLTLIEEKVKYQIPSSVLDDINSNGAKLQLAINSLMGAANPPQAEQPVGGAPAAVPAAQSGSAAVMAIATAIAGIADAMDKIDKAKKQKATPTTTIGIGVTDPIGAPGPGGSAGNQPIPFIGIKQTF